MRHLITPKSTANFTSHAGLGLIGMVVDRHTKRATDGAVVSALRSDARTQRDILASHIALLCLGKSDFEAITGFREAAFFFEALGVAQVPSEATLRQRMDTPAEAFRTVVEDAPETFPPRIGAPITALANGLVALDCDITPFDNARARTEGVLRTLQRLRL